jgi:DNA-binding response OmpR family regulator
MKNTSIWIWLCFIITLPNGNGLDLIKLLKNSRPQELLLFAKNSFDDKIDGLNLELMITCQNPFIYRNLMLE